MMNPKVSLESSMNHVSAGILGGSRVRKMSIAVIDDAPATRSVIRRTSQNAFGICLKN
jgi:hypothetical protein